ncbi:ABC transporter permease [Cellulosimicrobium funkei]|nr:ABC transporter permease [Cellulosimicrobium funkei]
MISPVAILLLWQLSSALGWIDTAVIASPLMVWDRLVSYIVDGSLFAHLGASLGRVLVGLAIGVVAGTVLGVVSGLSRFLDDIVDPPLQMVRTVPTLALMPLMLIFLGVDEALKVGLIAVGVVFPIYINVTKGIRGVDPGLRELAEVNGVGRGRLIREIVLPGAWPHFLIGLRFSLGISWLILVFAETIATDTGIGHLLSQGRLFMQTDVIILCLVLYAVLGLAIEAVVRAIETSTMKWRKEFV